VEDDASSHSLLKNYISKGMTSPLHNHLQSSGDFGEANLNHLNTPHYICCKFWAASTKISLEFLKIIKYFSNSKVIVLGSLMEFAHFDTKLIIGSHLPGMDHRIKN